MNTKQKLGVALIVLTCIWAVVILALAVQVEWETNHPEWYVPPVVAEPPLGYCDNHLACG